jgi:hypothetical protein
VEKLWKDLFIYIWLLKIMNQDILANLIYNLNIFKKEWYHIKVKAFIFLLPRDNSRWQLINKILKYINLLVKKTLKYLNTNIITESLSYYIVSK